MEAAPLLKEARSRSGLTVRQLSVRAATSHSAVVAYEAGTKEPGVATLTRLLRACGFVARIELRGIDPFEQRRARGEELRQVLDLADELPAEHRPAIGARFPVPRR